jgi:2-polyprenyl-3-methyl-5-hydroxy-6-metoxy-1,4-benzoquinol methylase
VADKETVAVPASPARGAVLRTVIPLFARLILHPIGRTNLLSLHRGGPYRYKAVARMAAPLFSPSRAIAPVRAKAWSAPATSRRVLDLLSGLDWERAQVADVGAGRGYFSQLACTTVRGRGLNPPAHVFACDLIPASFECEEIACAPIAADGRLPYESDRFDAVVSIEVIEHVEDQFAFLRELARIAKPGGIVIVTTPNTLNVNSRLRTLTSGFPLLFDPLPLDVHDPRRLGGHIHPISPYYLAYTALRVGLQRPTFHPDRTKKSAVVLTLVLAPIFLVGGALQRCRLRRKDPHVLAQNHRLLSMQNGWRMLTARTTVLRAEKGSGALAFAGEVQPLRGA